MPVVAAASTPKTEIAPKRERYLAHTDHLMVVVIDFADGPMSEPDPPHSHPHEQVTYVASGELIFYIEDKPHTLREGDLITVAPNLPHTIQLLTETCRLVDTFTPLRDEFIEG